MEIGKAKDPTLGLTRAIIKDNGLQIKWMARVFMQILRFNSKDISKMTILLDHCIDTIQTYIILIH